MKPALDYKILDILNNTKEIYMTDSSLNTLLDFERVIDEIGLYGYDHWKMGELVEGPVVEKYFIRCVFMWPYNKMPDPRGAKRLLNYNCKVYYKKSKMSIPVEIKTPNDYRPGTHKPKLQPVSIWLVNITMPKVLLKSIAQGSVDLGGDSVDLQDLQQAYEEDLSKQGLTDNSDENNEQQQQLPQQPQPF